MRFRTCLAVALPLLLALTACSGDDGGGDTGQPRVTVGPSEPVAALLTFDDCDRLLDHLKRTAGAHVGPYGFGGGNYAISDGGIPVDARSAAEAGDDAAAPTTATPVAGEDYSATNVQEAGVDEPDVIKTDGDRILAVAAGKLHYVDVAAAPRKRGSLALDAQGTGRVELLLSGDRVLVLREVYPTVVDPEGKTANPTEEVLPGEPDSRQGTVSTEVSVVSLADPDRLAVTDSFTVEGAYQTARLVDGTARVVVKSEPRMLGFVYPQTPGGEAIAEAANRRVIDNSKIDDWLPRLRHGDRTQSAVDCAQVFTPARFAGVGMVDVVTVAVAEELEPRTVSLAGQSSTVYASGTDLYVASPAWVDQQGGPIAGDAVAVLPPSSDIHQFDISAQDATYVASGRIPGTVLNQFSMSQHEDRLRVATTQTATNNGDSESFVRVLEASGTELVEVGAVGNMGKGEQIHSVRFIGPVGYVVTFRQTDPFYVLDLTDSSKPRVVGELKIPGYSGYLHPVSDDLVLGVGQDATSEGQQTGAKVSLFGVADPASPTELATWTVPGSQSGAEWDHRAFLYWPKSKLAVLPLSQYQFGGRAQPFSGAVGLEIGDDAIAERGRIEHPAASTPEQICPTNPEGGVVEPDTGVCAPVPYGAGIERSMVIGDQLWTYSAAGLLSSDLATLAAGPWVPFG